MVVGVGQFLLLKIPTSENGQASLCNKRVRNASIKRFKRDLNRLFPGPVCLFLSGNCELILPAVASNHEHKP